MMINLVTAPLSDIHEGLFMKSPIGLQIHYFLFYRIWL